MCSPSETQTRDTFAEPLPYVHSVSTIASSLASGSYTCITLDVLSTSLPTLSTVHSHSTHDRKFRDRKTSTETR